MDFKRISQIPFKDVLDFFNVGYEDENSLLKGEGFVVNVSRNKYYNSKGFEEGGVIKFTAKQQGLNLFEAGKLLDCQFFSEPKRKDIPKLTLHYDDSMPCDEETAKTYEVGYVIEKSLLEGKMAYTIYNPSGTEVVGYLGWEGKYIYSKDFKAGEYIFNYHRANNKHVILCIHPFNTLIHLQNGESAVALLNANIITDTQLRLMKKYEKVIFEGGLEKYDDIFFKLSTVCYAKRDSSHFYKRLTLL